MTATVAPALSNDPRVHAGIDALIDVGALFYQRNWSLGTSSNYSIRLEREPQRLLLTASGKDKRALEREDFVIVDGNGRLCEPPTSVGGGKPSAETMLHVMLARQPDVGSVLHTHSVWGTILSNLHHRDGGLFIEGYEMLKGLAGVTTHEHREWVPIFENAQDIPALATEVQSRLDRWSGPPIHGFLIRRHGLYTWGKDLSEARRHIEIFEFLFEVLGRSR